MRQELPGFYYDVEKNKYFSIKGAIPGSTSAPRPEPEPIQEQNYQKRTKLKALNLLYCRELNGNVIPINKTKSNFKDEIQKIHASNPEVWKYGSMANIGDAALKHLQIDIQTSTGQTRKNILVAGSTSGSVSILRVSKAGQHFDESESQALNGGINCIPVSVLSCNENESVEKEAPGHMRRPAQGYLRASSSITSINLIGRYDASENSHRVSRALITTLGTAGNGSLFFLNLDHGPNMVSTRNLHGGVSNDCNIWTADCNVNGSHAAIGTYGGAASVDLETGAGTYFLRSKSDVLALQHDQLGNIVQCGLRNGIIVLVDLREKPGRSFRRLTRHPTKITTNRKWFELKGNLNPSNIIYMPSSISCLKRLKTYDQYLMASSFDGTMKLYDQRMVKRGAAVQTYEGHVNSHTRIEFGMDPSESFLMSGGEDCYTRIWSIKSGQLLSEKKFSNSVPSAMCWSTFERQRGSRDYILHGAWLGTYEAIYNVL